MGCYFLLQGIFLTQRWNLGPLYCRQILYCLSYQASPYIHQAPLSMRFSRQEYCSGCHFLLQGIFPTQGSNPGLLHCRQMLYWLSYKGSPNIYTAKSPQSCPTLCDPIEGSPPGSPVHGILQARRLEWVAISSSNAWKWKVKVKSPSRVPLLATPWTAAYQAPLSMEFSRQEYMSGVPLPSPNIYTLLCIKWITNANLL